MGLENFHPKRAIVLSGYSLVDKLIPEYGVGNEVFDNFVMDRVLEQVELTPWVPEKVPSSSDGCWLYIKQKDSSVISPVFNILSQFSYALSALLPSGVVLSDMRVNDFVSTFKDENGDFYVETSNNNFISLTPVLNEKFLKYWDLPEPKEYSDKVVATILRDISRKLRVTSVDDNNSSSKVSRKKPILLSPNVSF